MAKKTKLNLRKINLVTSSALALMASSYSQANSSAPYPKIPLVWQSGVTSIKPNIMLFLDNSGSMDSVVPNSGNQTRINVARGVIRGIIDETRDENRWGLSSFLNRSASMRAMPAGPGYGKVAQGGTLVRPAANPAPALQVLGNSAWNQYGAEILSNVDDINPTSAAGVSNYNGLMNSLNALTPSTWTPIPSAYYELTRYYRGLTPGFPNLRTPGGFGAQYVSPIQYRCQRNYIIFISDGQETGGPIPLQLGNAYHTDTAFLPNTLRNNIRTTPSSADVNFVTGGIAGLMANTDLIDDATRLDAENKSFNDPDFEDQSVITYTVGFATNVPLLQNMAQQSGGRYFTANNGPALRIALLNALDGIRNSGYTPSTISVSYGDSPSGSTITAAASTTFEPSSWTSQLRFYSYDAANKTFDTTHYLTPKYITPAHNLTSIALISSPSGVHALAQNQATLPAGLANNATFGISPSRTDVPTTVSGIIPITTSANPNEYRNFLAWLLRWNNVDATPGSIYRDRNRNNTASLARFMGDVSGNVTSFGSVVVPAANSTDFHRREFMVVPSNDGMLHILTANTGADKNVHPYVEALQYIPGTAARSNPNDTILRNLVFTAETNYGDLRNPRQSFLAGELMRLSTNEGEHTLISSFGTGARGAFALMIGGKDHAGQSVGMNQPKANWDTSVPLWDTSTSHYGNAGSIYNEMGYIFGTPKGGYVSMANNTDWTNDVRVAMFMTSGMDDPNQATPGLFVLDHMGKNYATGKNYASTVAPGSLLRKIPITRAYSATPSAGASPAAILQAHDGLTDPQVIDINNDGLADLAYAGDYKGNVWRFDLRGSSPADWGARMIYESTGTGSQPLTAAPNLMHFPDGKVGVYFGTGSNLYQEDLQHQDGQSLYGIYDDVANCSVSAAQTGICRAATKADLIEQTLSSESIAGENYYYVSSNNSYTDNATRRGFYLNAPANHRIITTPEVVRVSGKASTSLVWVLEKVEANLNSMGAVQTCTPDSVDASGFKLLTDAVSGQTSIDVTWTANTGIRSTTGVQMASLNFKGSSSKPSFLGGGGNNANGGSNINSRGLLTDGTLLPPGTTPSTEDGNCRKTGQIGSNTSASGASLDEITCNSADTSIRRISWREIF